MPPQQEKPKPKIINSGPPPSIFQRLFGSSQLSPEMLQGIDIARKENPSIGNIEPYGPISRLISPRAQAYTSPGRTIYMNPNQLQGLSPEDVADTITHEQTHVNQMNQRDLPAILEFFNLYRDRGPYHQRPDEMEAFQAEQARRARMGRFQTAIPKFDTSTPEYYTPQDIQLPPMNPMMRR